MKIIFIRHGKDDDNYRGGWSNNDLILEGIEQAILLANHICDNNALYNITKIVSSDLPRAKTTAGYISDKLILPVLTDTSLREMNNGALAGMLNSEALIKYPGLFFSSLKMDENYPNGESPMEFFIRIKSWFIEFLMHYQNSNGNTLVVTHSGVINIIYYIVNNLEWNNKLCSYKVSYCSIHILNVDNMNFEVKNKTDFLYN